MPAVDLRSDTITKPTPEMLEAMTAAELGDDVLGDEPTARALERKTAELLGKQAALFVPSGTMANLLALLAQTRPGDEIIVEEQAHIVYYERVGYAAVAGLGVRTCRGERGIFAWADAEQLVRTPMSHYPKTTLVSVENTHNRAGGAVWPVHRLAEVAAGARARGIRVHMDGARLWNACAASGDEPSRLAAFADSVSVCFSKGLGCPVGSALVSDEPTIARARELRQMLGGSMRQSGVLAAAAIHALDHHRRRLAEDHRRARALAESIADAPGIIADPDAAETNIVCFDLREALGPAPEFCDAIQPEVRTFPVAPRTVRAVVHQHIDDDQIDRAATAIRREAERRA